MKGLGIARIETIETIPECLISILSTEMLELISQIPVSIEGGIRSLVDERVDIETSSATDDRYEFFFS
jgi:hypothetical protein